MYNLTYAERTFPNSSVINPLHIYSTEYPVSKSNRHAMSVIYLGFPLRHKFIWTSDKCEINPNGRRWYPSQDMDLGFSTGSALSVLNLIPLCVTDTLSKVNRCLQEVLKADYLNSDPIWSKICAVCNHVPNCTGSQEWHIDVNVSRSYTLHWKPNLLSQPRTTIVTRSVLNQLWQRRST